MLITKSQVRHPSGKTCITQSEKTKVRTCRKLHKRLVIDASPHVSAGIFSQKNFTRMPNSWRIRIRRSIFAFAKNYEKCQKLIFTKQNINIFSKRLPHSNRSWKVASNDIRCFYGILGAESERWRQMNKNCMVVPCLTRHKGNCVGFFQNFLSCAPNLSGEYGVNFQQISNFWRFKNFILLLFAAKNEYFSKVLYSFESPQKWALKITYMSRMGCKSWRRSKATCVYNFVTR